MRSSGGHNRFMKTIRANQSKEGAQDGRFDSVFNRPLPVHDLDLGLAALEAAVIAGQRAYREAYEADMAFERQLAIHVVIDFRPPSFQVMKAPERGRAVMSSILD